MPHTRKPLAFCILSGLAALLLAGCGNQPNLPLQPAASALGKLQGSVHGGQPPVAGSHVYLYESVSTGYGNAAHSLLTAASNTVSDGANYYTSTDSGGGFSLNNDYTCTGGAQVYVLARGGDAGGGPNPGIGLMAALGQCPGSGSLAAQAPFVIVNEVTTVAAAYALAGFMSSPTQLSTGNTPLAAAGLANAMANALNLVNPASGLAATATLASGSSGAVPQARIYTLANILASCVNSSPAGSPPSSTRCSALFAAAAPVSTPSDTAQAMLNIAHFPGNNVATLYNLSTATPVFAPTLSTAPDDLLLPVVYTAPISPVQNGLAIDAAGNAWVAGGTAIGRITPLGAASTVYTSSSPSSNFNLSSVSVSPSGNTWVSDASGSTVTLVNGSGLVGITPALIGGLSGPAGIAFDTGGNAFVENHMGNTVSLLMPSAAAATPSPIPSRLTAYQIAVDGLNGAWASSYGSSIQHIPAGAAAATPVAALSGYNQSVAIDGGGSIWVGGDNGGSGALAKLSSDGSLQGIYTGGGATGFGEVAQLAIDGGGNVWGIGATPSFGYTYSHFVELSNTGTALSPAAGYQNAANFGNLALAIDGSGDVWVSNANATTTEFLGAAVPVATPILPAQLGARP